MRDAQHNDVDDDADNDDGDIHRAELTNVGAVRHANEMDCPYSFILFIRSQPIQVCAGE